MNKCCGNCEYRKSSKLKIQFNENLITAYCNNNDSLYFEKYVWDENNCDKWKGVSSGRNKSAD